MLSINSLFWVNRPGTTADTVWRNLADPPARGGLLSCNVNTGNKEVTPEGWGSLGNIGDHPDPARSASGSGPLNNRGFVTDETIVDHLPPLRHTRLGLPETPAAPDAPDLTIHRVMVSGGWGATVEIRAGRAPEP